MEFQAAEAILQRHLASIETFLVPDLVHLLVNIRAGLHQVVIKEPLMQAVIPLDLYLQVMAHKVLNLIIILVHLLVNSVAAKTALAQLDIVLDLDILVPYLVSILMHPLANTLEVKDHREHPDIVQVLDRQILALKGLLVSFPTLLDQLEGMALAK